MNVRVNARSARSAAVAIATAIAVGALLPTSAAFAQDSARVPVQSPSPRKVQGRGAAQPKPRRPVVDKLQARVDDVLRQRLQLTDDQFSKLRALNVRLDEEKRAIRAEETQTRKALRNELLPGATPNEAHVAELLDRMPVVERRRIAMQEREQKELAEFMQPTQRARYFALQDEIRRSLQDVQRLRGAPSDSGNRSPPALRPTPLRGPGGRLLPVPPPPPTE